MDDDRRVSNQGPYEQPAAKNMLTTIKTVAKIVGDPIYWLLSERELKRLLARYPSGSSADVISITREYRGQGWYKRLGAFQVPEEFARLADWAVQQRPRVVLEIGTAAGATLLLWARVAQKRAISIDLPGGIHGGGYPKQKARLFRSFVRDRPGVSIHLIRASSQDASTKTLVRSLLDDEPVDILFIDGDHRLAGVTRDFQLWFDLVRPGGSVVLHDILHHTRIPSCQVDLLWQNIKMRYPGQTTEIVASRDQGWAGIGILTV